MRMRGLGLALLVGAMMPGTSRAQATPVPDVLKSYGKDGTFDPGDFGWMAGRFAAEGTAARAAWESIAAYKEACIAAATGKAKAELAAIGAESSNLPPGPYGDEACRAITAAMAIDAGSEAERAALPARLAEARQLWDFALAGGRMGIGAVTSAVGPPESEDAQMLIGATFRTIGAPHAVVGRQ